MTTEQFLSDAHLTHFRERLHVREVDGEHFFYLQETKDAEDLVNHYINDRLAAPDIPADFGWVEGCVETEATHEKLAN